MADANDLKKQLEAKGFKVKLTRPTVLKTFEVDSETLYKFLTQIECDAIKQKEAIHEALNDWLKKRQKI